MTRGTEHRRMQDLALSVLMVLGLSLGSSAQEGGEALEQYQSTITVYGTRVPLEERMLSSAASPVVVVTREQLEETGAATVQEVLETLPGITLHNQTGNPVDTTVDLRLFPQAPSVAVFLDGVRLNNLDNNDLRWDIIPVEDLERIEVYAGTASPLYGGGALGGVVNLVTRRNEGIPRVDLKATLGSFGYKAGRLHASGKVKEVEFYATAQKARESGWRENDGHNLDDGLAKVRISLPKDQSLSFTAKYSGGTIQAPGALTAAELVEDREQTPFNLTDNTRGRHRLGALAWSWVPEKGGWSAQVMAYDRRHDRDIFATGRFASWVGMGFGLASEERLRGLVADVRHEGIWGDWSWDLSLGAEGTGGEYASTGFYASMDGSARLGDYSRTQVDQLGRGGWLSADVGYKQFHAITGFRADRVRYDYRSFDYPELNTRRSFSEETWRLGGLWHPHENHTLFVTYSEGYRIPTVSQLFSSSPYFPANPTLRPTRANDWEAGYRLLGGKYRFTATLFRVDARDEVVFVITDPIWFIGENQNVGRALRKGIELQGHFQLPWGFSLNAAGSYTDAEVTAGPYEGKRMPMASRYQGALDLGWNYKQLDINLTTAFVGPQLLDSDLDNQRPGLGGYTTVNLTGRFTRGAFGLQAGLYNLFDKEYVPRGITNGVTDYFTPARPFGAQVSVSWSF